MTRSQKITISVLVMLAIVFVMAFALTMSPNDTAYALDSLTGVSFNNDTGALRWDSFPSASNYWMTFGGDSFKTNNNYFNLEEYAISQSWVDDTYSYSLYAIDGYNNPLSATYEGSYTYTTLKNVSLSAEGVLSWDSFAGASDYYYSFAGGGGLNDGLTSVDFKTYAKQRHLDSDTYDWYVYAVDGDDNKISAKASGEYVYVSDQTPLATPTNLTWTNSTLSWDAVDYADEYVLYLYKNSSFTTYFHPGKETSYTFVGLDVDYTYYVTVQANVAKDDLVHRDSERAQSPNVSFEKVVDSLASYVTINVEDGKLNFNNTGLLSSAAIIDVGVDGSNGSYNLSVGGTYEISEFPKDLYLLCSGSGLIAQTCDVRVKAYDENYIPLAPLYTTTWEYDPALGPQPLTGTVTITGTAKHGQTLTAVVDSNNTGTLSYDWYYQKIMIDYSLNHIGTNSNTLVVPQECIGFPIMVTVSSSKETGYIYSSWTDPVQSNVENDLEVVSVGDNPVSAEIPYGEIVQGSFPMGRVGEGYSATLVAEGGSGTHTWSLIWGSLANGLTLNSSTGVVSGTPTETKTGYITIRCTDSVDNSIIDDVNLTFLVYADSWIPTITTNSLDNAVINEAYGPTVLYCDFDSGASTFEISWTVIDGSLPTGIILGKSGTWNGYLSGTPTVAGTYNFTLKAQNDFGYDTQTYTIVVDNPLELSYVEAIYYLGDTVQVTADIGNSNVTWSVSGNSSANTTISAAGLLTIGADETNSAVTVYATSKTNSNNGDNIEVEFVAKTPYTITVINGTSTNSSAVPISRAGVGESVYIEANSISGKQFREWTVEEGSAAVVLSDENNASCNFTMLAGNAIVKANYDTIIDTVSATFDTPINGGHVNKVITAGDTSYTATLSKIWAGNTYVGIDDYVYATGVSCSYFITFEATAGNVLVNNSDLFVTLNGHTLTYSNDYVSSGWRISYYAVSVVNCTASPMWAVEGSTINIVANTAPDHYQFSEWTASNNEIEFNSTTNAISTFVIRDYSVTITANYENIKHTVSFNANGGTGTKDPVLVNEADSYDLPANPFTAPEGKKFGGWSYTTGGEVISTSSIVINDDVDLYAIWVHAHSIEVVNAKDPDCENAGNIQYYECTSCHHYFSDSEGNNEINIEDTVVDALGHDWGAWDVITAATENSEGLERRVCNRDPNHIQERTIPMLGHVHNMQHHDAIEATCTNPGNIAYYECTGCHHYYSDELGNNELNAEEVVIAALGHNWGDWNETTPPTCTEAGIETRVCSRDANHTETRPVDATGHDYGAWTVTTQPTCTEAGIETRVCSHDANHKETRPVDAIGHEWGEWTVTTQPTCTETGIKTRVCAHDANHKETDSVPAIGHEWGAWVITTQPQPGVEGVETRVCAHDANHKETRAVAALPYEYKEEGGVKTYEADISANVAKDVKSLFEQAKAGNGKVEVSAGTMKITFNEGAVNAIGGKSVSLTANVLTENLDIAGAQLVVELTLAGSTFESGKATISVPFTTVIPDGKIAKVYYVNGNERVDMSATFADGKVTFDTNHFSKFAVVFEDKPADNNVEAKKPLSGGAIAGIVIACVVVLAGIGVGVFFLLKKKGIIGKK